MGSTNHSQTELFNLSNLKWKDVMQFSTYKPYNWIYYSASFFYKDHFYITGGRVNDSISDQSQKLIIKFNPKTETWLEVGHLNLARYGHSVMIVKSKVFIIGGNKNSEICDLSEQVICNIIGNSTFTNNQFPHLYGHTSQSCKPGKYSVLALVCFIGNLVGKLVSSLFI